MSEDGIEHLHATFNKMLRTYASVRDPQKRTTSMHNKIGAAQNPVIADQIAKVKETQAIKLGGDAQKRRGEKVEKKSEAKKARKKAKEEHVARKWEGVKSEGRHSFLLKINVPAARCKNLRA
jgi:hypothetical protein